MRSYNPGRTSPPGLGWSAFARRYWRSRCCFLFLGVLRCFSSPGWLGHPGINARLTAPPGLSWPPTPDRLLAPRHPPHALSSLATPPPPPSGEAATVRRHYSTISPPSIPKARVERPRIKKPDAHPGRNPNARRTSSDATSITHHVVKDRQSDPHFCGPDPGPAGRSRTVIASYKSLQDLHLRTR
jgi:hypothetical protein